MMKILKNLFKKSETPNFCSHGWEIPDPDKLPYKIRGSSLSVCPDCAISSSLTQMGSGIKLNEDSLNYLKDKCPNLFIK